MTMIAPSETVYADDEAKEPYGDVKYADPGYRQNVKRYPIDTEAHVRAAWAYINMPRNASKYTPDQLDLIKGRIKSAAKRHGVEIAEAASVTGPEDMGMPSMPSSLPRRSIYALLAGAAPLTPPSAWFQDPKFEAPTRLKITEDGHVFGHLAQWRVCHVGIGNSCVMAPKTRTDYGLFKIGSVICEDGTEVQTGKIVMGSAHANAQWGVMPARDFYDNTSMAAAVVTIGEDRHGIWVNGVLSTTMTPERVAELRSSALSGDWRTVNGNLELIAALAVNSPGFPIYREENGRAFSMQSVGVLELEDEPGVADMTEDSSTELAAPPTGITSSTADAEQQARMQRLQEIDESLEKHRREQRMAQLAVLEKELEELEDVPVQMSETQMLRNMSRNGRMQVLPEPELGDDEDDDEDVEED